MFYIMPKDTELPWVQAIKYPTSPVTASWQIRVAKLPKLSISFDSKACDAERKLEDNIMYRDHVFEKYPHWTASDWQTHALHYELQNELLLSPQGWLPLVEQIHDLNLLELEINF